MKRIVLIDGHNLLFRMYYGIPAPIRNSKGKDIRGLIGFIGSLKKIIAEFTPYSVLVVFDSETSQTTNLNIDATYKANRPDFNLVEEDENPFSQLEMIKDALTYLNIEHIEVLNYEADDYIASIVSNKKGYEYIVVSTDSDFIQLVNKSTYLYVPRGKKSVLYDEEKVYEKYQVSPNKYILYKSLVGDTSDNIQGIKGIGPVTASKILAYDSILEYIFNNPESRISKILKNNKEIIERNIKLISMNKDLDVTDVELCELLPEIINYKTYEIIEKIGAR